MNNDLKMYHHLNSQITELKKQVCCLKKQIEIEIRSKKYYQSQYQKEKLKYKRTEIARKLLKQREEGASMTIEHIALESHLSVSRVKIILTDLRRGLIRNNT